MTFRKNLLRARSHLVTVAVLLIAGTIIVRVEDRDLARETGKPTPQKEMGVLDRHSAQKR